MALSKERLDEIEARLKAATPERWDAVPIVLAGSNETSGWGESTGYVINGPPQRIEDITLSRRWFERREDAVLISNAPTDLADLLAEVRRLRALPQKWPDVQRAVENLATIYLTRAEKAERDLADERRHVSANSVLRHERDEARAQVCTLRDVLQLTETYIECGLASAANRSTLLRRAKEALKVTSSEERT